MFNFRFRCSDNNFNNMRPGFWCMYSVVAYLPVVESTPQRDVLCRSSSPCYYEIHLDHELELRTAEATNSVCLVLPRQPTRYALYCRGPPSLPFRNPMSFLSAATFLHWCYFLRNDKTAVSMMPNSAKESPLSTGKTRQSRKRAPVACQSCHARKVRCSLPQTGSPCANCSLDELSCVPRESRRSK
jgi:hypothetical protein